jgi:ribose transport system substrate-binding protein
MKSAHKNTVFIVLLGITAALIVGSAFLQLRVGVNAAKTSRIDPGKEYGLYVMLIAERIDSPFWQMVYAGALEAAEELDCVVELSGPLSGADRRSTDEYLDYAIAARVDGILCYVHDDAQTRANLALAAKKGIPVVTLENDSVSSPRISFVGVSSWELGKLLGEQLVRTGGNSSRALVLTDGSAWKSSENIMLSGMREAVRQFSGISVVPLGSADFSGSGFEEAVRRRIMEDMSLDVIVSLRVEDTMLAAQSLIELNQTNRVSVVSFRESPEIYEYLRKGIVSAVVVVDARQMGRRAIESLVEYLDTGHTNDYVITDMHVVNAENLGVYRE